MKRFLSLLTVLVLIISLCPVFSQAAAPADFKGLVLTAPSNVTVKLYTGYSEGTQLTPAYTETGTVKSYYYSVSSGNYRYVVSGSGYYTITKCVYISSTEAKVKTVLDVTPPKKAGGGWETTSANLYSDEAIALALNDDISQWPEYADVFTTPWFTNPHGEHQMSTQQEMETFIQKLDDPNDKMYSFSAGTAAGSKGFDIPVVLFSQNDLSGATTVEEAVAKMDLDKPTILYRAQVHGNEPAAGEAALAMIQRLDGSYGDEVLSKLNICIFPRMNPDGAYNYERTLASGDDPNRDHLRIRNPETEAFLKLSQLLEPEVLIDGHEYSISIGSSYLTDGDITISTGHSVANSAPFAEAGISLMHNAFDAMAENGLNYRYYSNCVNGYNPNIAGQYISRQGTLFCLLESRGIRGGMSHFSRRVVSHVISAESIIDYVAQNATQVVDLVAAERARIISNGATYEDSDQVILSTGEREDTDHSYILGRYYQNGKKNTLNRIPESYDIVLRSRTAPTAYVIPAGESYTQKVLGLMDKQGISYEFLPAGTCIMLQQYTGTVEEAGLTEETVTSFPNGAYVFCKNQMRGITLSMLMEPDVTDASENKGTLAQQGILVPTNGVFPIYRYVRDLNNNGTIDTIPVPAAPTGLQGSSPTVLGQTGSISGLRTDMRYEYRVEGSSTYIPVPAGAVSIEGLQIGTYYIRYQKAGDSLPSADAVVAVAYADTVERIIYLNSKASTDGDGFTEATATNKIETAYAQLAKVMASFPEGTSGKIVVIGSYTLSGDTVKLPSHTFPVVITGKTPKDGLVYAPTSATQADRQLVLGGPTTLEHTTLTYKSTRTLSAIYAAGHPFTVGENVTTVPASSGYHLNIVGGTYSGTVESTNLTVRSGTWKNIYVGGFACTVTSTASLTMTGGEITNGLVANYRKNTGERVTMNISNAKIAVLHCGNAYREDLTADVTLTLGEGFSCPTVHAGSRDEGNVLGTVTIIVDGADLTDTKLYGICRNANGNGSTVKKSILLVKNGTLGSYESFNEVILDTSAGGTVASADNMTVDSVIGGGILELGNTKSLTVTGSASGVTGIRVAAPMVGAAYVQAKKTLDPGNFVYIGDGVFTSTGSSWKFEARTSPVATVTAGSLSWNAKDLPSAFTSPAADLQVKLLKSTTGNVSVNRDAILDLNGFSINGTVSVANGNTLQCMDSQTGDYDISDNVCGSIQKVTGQVVGKAATENTDGYLMLSDSNGVSFHAVGLNITDLTLRPDAAGLYYTAAFRGDSAVQKAVTGYGIAMSVHKSPNSANMDVSCKYTCATENFGTANSVILSNVLRQSNSRTTNLRNGAMPVYGRAYIRLADGRYMFGPVQSRSLQQQVELIDSKLDTLTAAQKTALFEMYKLYPEVMANWTIPNLKAAAK